MGQKNKDSASPRKSVAQTNRQAGKEGSQRAPQAQQRPLEGDAAWPQGGFLTDAGEAQARPPATRP